MNRPSSQMSKVNRQMSMRGFTMIELLIVLSILVVLASVGIWSFVGIRNVKTLDLTAVELIANLRSIQQKAVAQEQSSKWGMRIDAVDADTDFYETFSGDTYAGGAIASRITLPTRVEFIYPAQGNTRDIIFSQLTGYPDDVHTIVLALVGDSSADRTVRVITINAKGLISLDDSAMGPTAPLNLTAAGESDQIVLNWSAPEFDGGSAITNYKIYRGAYPDEETLLTTAGTGLTYADSSASRGVQYYYKVSAVNSFAEGVLSNEASAAINRRIFITSIAYNGNLGGLSGADAKCQARATAAGLGGATWKAWLSGSGGSASSRLNHFSGYNLVNGTLVANSWADLTDGSLLSPISITEFGVSWWVGNYAYTGTNSDGSSIGSNCDSWTTNYGGNFGITGGVGDTTSLWTNKVAVVCSDNRPLYCFEDLATIPAAPTSLSGVVGQGQVTLNWLAPSSDGGSPVTNYKIYRGTTSGGEIYLATAGNVLTYIDSGLIDGTTYYYKVSAVNIIGEGPQGSEISKIPNIPVRVFVTSGAWDGRLSDLLGADAKCQAAADARSLGGTWNAWLSTTNTSAESRLSHRGFFQLINGTVIADNWADLTDGALANAISINEWGTTNGGEARVWTHTRSDGEISSYTYDCGGWAQYEGTTNNYGNSSVTNSQWTDLSSTVNCSNNFRLYCFEQIDVPGAPVGLSAASDDTQSILTWSVPSFDGGKPVTNYKIYRGTVSGEEVYLTTVDNILTYTDTGLTNGTTYYYKVSAVNEIGEGSQGGESSVIPNVIYKVFVTSTTYSGNLDGLSGADAKCQARAVVAGLGGLWKAWISSDSVSASTRLYHHDGLYKLVNGTAVANNWTDLTDGTLLAAININESSGGSSARTWTNTQANGLIYSAGYSCSNWTASSGNGRSGYSTQTGGGWTNNSSAYQCGFGFALYCFEQPPVIPDAPTGLAASSGIGQIALTWSAPASDGGSSITNYIIYRGTTPGGEVEFATIGDVLNYTDEGLSDGIAYYYKVSAVNGVGEGARSSETSATTLSAPTAPLNLAGTSGETQAVLNWSVPASDGGSAITNYKVYRSTVSGGEVLLDSGGCASLGSVLTCTDAGLTNGTTYYYKVSAVNGVGEGAQSSEASVVPSRKRVFVTNALYNGNLGGLDGADAKCQTSADSAGLGGTWKAWMSTTAISAASRLNNTGPYQLITGTLVANNWSDLVDSVIATAININESGSTPSGTNYSVWTNTNPDGSIHTLVADSACRNWTASYIYRVTLWGRIGQRNRTDLGWSSATSINCALTARLYCFEQ